MKAACQFSAWLLVVALGCGARGVLGNGPTDSGGLLETRDASIGKADSGSTGSLDAATDAHDALQDVARAYCETACAEDPPICVDGHRGNPCLDTCTMLYVAQTIQNDPADPCPLGRYDLISCLAENPGACEDADMPACYEEWNLFYNCQDGM